MHNGADQPQHSSSASAPDFQRPDQDSDGQSDDDQDNESVSRAGKRKRPLSVSCELCKQRKVKCDRGQPSCGWCSRNNATCEYKERRAPGLRAGYGRRIEERSLRLEQRVDQLEEIIRSHAELIQSSLATQSRHVPSILNGNASGPSDQGTPHDARSFRPSEPVPTPNVDASLFLSKHSSYTPNSQNLDFGVPATPNLHDGFQASLNVSGIPVTAHMPAAQPTTAAQDFYAPRQASLQSSIAANDTVTPDQDMPPYDLLYALVDLYFRHVNTWCPILHRKTTLDGLFGPSTLQETDRILLHAIVATTMRYSNDPRLTPERRQHYHQVSKQRVLLYGMENSSVKSLQALVILALDLCGTSNGPPGWNILALITRSVVQLGLAVETTSFSIAPTYKSIYTLRAMVLAEPKDFIEEESRRRLFWMIYLLDRYATIATAFEFALDDREIDRALPCRDDLWMQNQKVSTRWFKKDSHRNDSQGEEINEARNLGAFSYFMEILGIFSEIHKFLRQPVDISALDDVEKWQLKYKELDNTLTGWKFGLPTEFGNMAKLYQPGSKNLSCLWVMLHATYHTAVIRLHSSAAYPTTRSPIFTPSYSASQRCHGAVENIAALGEFVVNNGMLAKLGPPFAWTLWVSARLLLVHGSTVEHALSPQISFLVDALRQMGQYWPVAARYCKLLQRVLDEHRDSERQGDGVTPSSVKILADMRRTAFEIDLLISRQPHHGSSNPATLPSVTPARTPAPNELEYLDVFDFFNVPRLPFGGENIAGSTFAPPPQAAADMEPSGSNGGGGPPNEFNITNFMVDASSDWLFKQEGGKYMAAS